MLCAMIHSAQAVELVKNKVKQIRLEIRQKEYDGESHNVIAELPGKREEWIVLSAHYDTTSLSHGAYDNMSGCAGLLGIMEQMKGKELNYGLRFVFCGSEERGLLGSKAYVRDHEKELRQTVLNINLDMIGTYMGKFIACVSAEEKLTHYISYMAAEVGFPIAAENGVYSSDSTPFADHGVPAVSAGLPDSEIDIPIDGTGASVTEGSSGKPKKDMPSAAKNNLSETETDKPALSELDALVRKGRSRRRKG